MSLGFTCPKSEGNYGTWYQWSVNKCLDTSVRKTLVWVTGDPHPKIEYVTKNYIFGLKMMMKSGLEKFILKFLHARDYFHLLHESVQNHKFSNKNNYLPAWRDFKINFSRPLFTIIFRPKMVFLNTDSILRVKTMYESVK